jgi:hypothetical protein
VARQLWPSAPLEYAADDGTVGTLILAGLAYRDHRQGIDRGALIEHNAAKAKAVKSRARQARKAQKALAIDADPWGIVPQAASQDFNF